MTWQSKPKKGLLVSRPQRNISLLAVNGAVQEQFGQRYGGIQCLSVHFISTGPAENYPVLIAIDQGRHCFLHFPSQAEPGCSHQRRIVKPQRIAVAVKVEMKTFPRATLLDFA